MACLPRASPVSQELLAFLVPDEVVGSLMPIEDINDNLTGFKLLPPVSPEASLLHLEDSLEARNSLPPALTRLVAAPLDSTLPHEDRRTYLALDGLGFHQLLKHVTTISVLAKIWLYSRSGWPAFAGV